MNSDSYAVKSLSVGVVGFLMSENANDKENTSVCAVETAASQ